MGIKGTVLGIVFLVVIALMHPAFASISGRFPESGSWEGMYIEYTIEGVTSPGYIDHNWIEGAGSQKEFHNSRNIDGFFTDDVLIVYGIAYADKPYSRGEAICTYRIPAEDGTFLAYDENKTSLGFESSGQSQFMLTLPIPKSDSVLGDVKISLVDYDLTRFLSVVGNFTKSTGETPPPKCDRLVLDLNEAPGSVVIAQVVDVCEYKPLDNVTLDIRIFHTYDAQLKKAINGSYVDLLPKYTYTNGTARIPVNGNPGDIYRVDVYASKEGWDATDRSIHVTVGQGGGTNGNGSGTSFTGAWNTDYGTLTLVQEGEQVTGEYSHDGGTIEGTVIGNVLKGTWSEAPTRQPPDDAGEIEFQLNPQGTSFTGRWRYDSSGEWKGWNGKLMEEKY
jgi:hypothetical protein